MNERGLLYPVMMLLALLVNWGCEESKKEQFQDAGNDGHSSAYNDAYSDAEAGSNVDADADCDIEGECGYGTVECTENNDCGLVACGCTCPRLWGEEEIQSFCYASCDKEKRCEQGYDCVLISKEAKRGVCLSSGYWETRWQGKFTPSSVIQPTVNDFLMGQDVPFNVGSISINFTMSIVWEIEDTENGPMIAVIYSAGGGTKTWILQILFPKSKYESGIIDFSDCDSCLSSLTASYPTSWTPIKEIYAVSLPEQNLEKKENWIQIEEAHTTHGEKLEGSLKLLFSEYFAELDVPESGSHFYAPAVPEE